MECGKLRCQELLCLSRPGQSAEVDAPDALRGRSTAVYTMTFQSFMRLGCLQAGFVADRRGVPIALDVGAVVSLIYGAFITVRYPVVRRM